MSSFRQPTRPIVGGHDYKTVQCGNCADQISIPVRCNQCGTDISPLLRGDAYQTSSTSKVKVACDRCGTEFKRSADKKRHQLYSCSVRTDATEGELYYCPLRSTESCAERGYRPDKLIDHLRQAHNFERSSGGAHLSYQGQDQSRATPPEGRFEQMSISGGTGSWYSGQSPSLGGQEQGIAGASQQYPQQQRLSPQLNAPYDSAFPFDETLYEDNAAESRYPLPAHPLALDSGTNNVHRHHQSRNSAGASYLGPNNPSGLRASGNTGHVGQDPYPVITDPTTSHSRHQQHPRQQYQDQANLDTGPFAYPTTGISPWDGNSDNQTAYSHSRAPDSVQYPARNEPSQRRQGRNRGDGRQGGRG
ncbi:MAG: hypothetical protein M1840_007933 [Geoglossum simile]|nr:MAG: hypothetical protein M1840_007933 [Geoglossum simile]